MINFIKIQGDIIRQQGNFTRQQAFGLIFADKSVELFYYDFDYASNEDLYKSLILFLEKQTKEIECFVIDIRFSTFIHNIPVKNIILVVSEEQPIHFLDVDFLNKSKHNFTIFFVYPSTHFNTKVMNVYKSANINFLFSKVGFFGQCFLGGFQAINNLVKVPDYDKLSQLKSFDKVYWAGQTHFQRDTDMQFLRDLGVNIVIEDKPNINYSATKDYLIDVLIRNECFCALSLDGYSIQCFRDTEIALHYVPNFKYTPSQTLDASANNNIYLANNSETVLAQLNNIKNDLLQDNFTKLIKNKEYMVRVQKFSLLRNPVLQSALAYFNIDINLLITHPLLDKSKSNKDWGEQILSNLNVIYENNNNLLK